MSSLVNNWICIESTSATRSDVIVRFGEVTKVLNVPNYQAEGLASKLVTSAVRRYINHRYEILSHYGGYMTYEKKLCLQKLRLAFHKQAPFKLNDLPQVLNNWSDMLFAIRPGRTSQYYQRDIALLADIVAFANYYTRHPFHVTKAISYAQ
jgi:hypothetical protein